MGIYTRRVTYLDVNTKEVARHENLKDLGVAICATYKDSISPANRNILKVLEKTPYLRPVVYGIDSAGSEEFKEAKQLIQRHIPSALVLNNSSEKMKKIYEGLEEQIGSPVPQGKGRNAWGLLGVYSLLFPEKSAMFFDSDIRKGVFSEEFLLRMAYPRIKDPSTHYTKAYYKRVTRTKKGKELRGRVRRLLVNPLLRSLKEMYSNPPAFLAKKTGDDTRRRILSYLDDLLWYEYPLAGEFVVNERTVPKMPIKPDWAMEIGILAWIHENNLNVAQVNLGMYDHKHQPLSVKKPDRGLLKMANVITRAVLSEIEQRAGKGTVDREFMDRLSVLYKKYSDMAIKESSEESAIEGYYYNTLREKRTVDNFSKSVRRAWKSLRKGEKSVTLVPWQDADSQLKEMLADYAGNLDS